jgi:hypothetical protein
MVTRLKAALFSREARARTIPLGLYRGLTMQLDLTRQLQLFLGLAERETHARIRNACASLGAAIDVGAGEGELTVFMLRRTAAKRVFAFEPSQSGRDKIVSNLALNNCSAAPRVFVSPNFVGSRDGHDTCALDSLIGDLSAPVFIKIDVDGAEMDVLKGASRLLHVPGCSWLVETHSATLEQGCLETFRQAGYKTCIIPKGWYRCFLPETRPSPHNRWLFANRDMDDSTFQ